MDLSDIRDALAATPVVLQQQVRGLSDAALRAGHDEDHWSIKEVLWHLRDTEEISRERYRRIVDEEQPYLPAFDQEAYARDRGYQDADAMAGLDGFIEQRQQTLALFGRISEAELARTGNHEELGTITLAWLVQHIIAHDLGHLAQIARAVN